VRTVSFIWDEAGPYMYRIEQMKRLFFPSPVRVTGVCVCEYVVPWSMEKTVDVEVPGTVGVVVVVPVLCSGIVST
jgi:hypothetical protein